MAISNFGEDVDRLLKQHAVETYPRECVACVLPGNIYQRLENTAENPEEEFRVSSFPIDAVALLHSHPGESPAPSAADMGQQQAMGIPWGILGTDGQGVTDVAWFGDTLQPEPYTGRNFLSGVRDCWGLIRDWYRLERGVILDNLPRDEDWFKRGVDLLNSVTFANAGFRRINQDQLKPGDVIVGKVGSRVNNHCALYLGRGLILSHISQRLSAQEPISPWLKYCSHFLRHSSSEV